MMLNKLKPLEVGPYVKRALSAIAGLSQQAKHEEAVASARQLQAEFPKRADVNDGLSLALVDQKNLNEALAFAENAVRLEPRNAVYLVNLGRLLLDLHDVERALPVLERARQARPSPPEAAWAVGRFYFDIGQAEKAIPYFEEAQRLVDPARLEEVNLEFLEVLRASNRIETAERLIDDMRISAKGNTAPLLALKSSLRKTQINDPLAQDLMAITGSVSVDKPEYSRIMLEVGRIHENSGKFEEAFHYYGLSKESRQRLFGLDAFESEVEGLIGAFSPDNLRGIANVGNMSEQPVFVVGMPRSGTTMTEQIIGAHPNAQGVGELPRIQAMMRKLAPPGQAERMIRFAREARPETFLQVSKSYLNLINFLGPGKLRLVDKMPHNFLAVGFISLCFPNAKIVHVHRNPLDNFVSAYQNPMNEFHSYSYDQETYGRYYLLYKKLMQHWQSALPKRIFDWPYDEVVQNPEHYTRQLIAYLGLPWHDDCLRFHEKQTTVKTFSMHQVRNPISAKSVGRWRNYEAQLGPIREILGL